jgi:hypothetical protein
MTTRRRTRRPSRTTVAKDILSYLGGWGLIVHQALVVPAADFNLTLVLLGGTLVGIPGVGQLLALRTGSPPSGDPEPDSSPSRSRSRSGSEGDRDPA